MSLKHCEIPESCPLSEEAADAAVKKVFAILGVDVDVPKEVEAFRHDLRFGAALRRYADRGMLTVVGAVALFFLGALGVGLIKIIFLK